MFGIRPLLLLLQVCYFPRPQAASPPLPLHGASNRTILTKPTNLTTTSHPSVSLASPNNEIRLFFADPGSPIPPTELRKTLFLAIADVQVQLPHHANEPISQGLFETDAFFPETRDRVFLSVHSFGFGLSWLQLSISLIILRHYMFGTGAGHPMTHYQELEFYIQIGPAIEVATGSVKYSPGMPVVAKRQSATVALQIPRLNVSSQSNTDLPIIYRIRKSTLDLNVTALGIPIPESTILDTLDAAFTDIILNHPNIDSIIPTKRLPYSFNETSGKPPDVLMTEVVMDAYPGQLLPWGLLCILYYGLRDFFQDTKHFNEMKFEVIDARVGHIVVGEVLHGPAGDQTALAGVL